MYGCSLGGYNHRSMELAQTSNQAQIAAVDLGSNSFHMIIAQMQGGELKLVDRLREQVRLADGLDADRYLDPECQMRALECLGRFGQRLAGLPSDNIRIVGTNTLRSARNSQEFLDRAGALLGHEIEIVSGIEEARLIYLGVAHGLASDSDANRLVIDIGGGSTELIIGRRFTPLLMESLYMGCITMTNRFFPGGKITPQAMDEALLEARLELEPRVEAYRDEGWDTAIGASGTILAVDKVLAANGWSTHGITLPALHKLKEAMLAAADIDQLKLAGLGRERAAIFPGGVVILLAAIDELGIDVMRVSDGALREGLLYDLIGRHYTTDVRDDSVKALASRYHVDTQQSRRVRETTAKCLAQVAESWKLDDEYSARWLSWAAELHEIGLDIAHSHYQKHGAYIIEHADLAGFSYQEQRLLALLVLAHRRKFPGKLLKEYKSTWGKKAERLAVLLRLACLLHRSRSAVPLPELRLEGKKKWLAIHFPPTWLEEHPLTRTDLEHEARYLANHGITLEFD